jgi:hypothetical protein
LPNSRGLYISYNILENPPPLQGKILTDVIWGGEIYYKGKGERGKMQDKKEERGKKKEKISKKKRKYKVKG